ncbi:MAG TPA: 2-hydroxychromene-2-carboxylate isomerase [Casimicrobiaceae bacterium]|nr:2-hydroxychromene-2-carboxylate isomerase [Casimicrobiaceae bacterium]
MTNAPAAAGGSPGREHAPVEFYFDFSSPYGFLAAQKIGAIALRHRRAVDWTPILLGVIFKKTGSQPLTEIPLKGEYAKRDFERSARFHGLPRFRLPSRFPVPTQVPARLITWLKDASPGLVPAATLALYRAYFEDDIDISVPEHALAAAAGAGVDRAEAQAAIESAQVKDALRAAVDRAIARGVFGSPFIIVEGEPFWGLDRLEHVERWLEKGGF